MAQHASPFSQPSTGPISPTLTEEPDQQPSYAPQDIAVVTEDVESFVKQTDRMIGAIDESESILTDVRKFNKSQWIMRYPSLRPTVPPPSPESPNKRRPSARHSLSFADEPTKEIDVSVSSRRKSMKRSLTLATVPDEVTEEAESTTEEDPNTREEQGLIPTDLQILRLDLKLGPHSTSTAIGGLVSQLERSSIANLIDERIGHALKHLDKLRIRTADKSSKVLVTGDLNAGKSTLINALLGREIMPVDQQPCTSLFCEIVDASENDGVEEAHLIDDCMSKTYNRTDESTFTRVPLSQVEEIISDSESNDGKGVLKLYIKDPNHSAQSLLNNGVVDISLIDAPGLNRDSLQTTQIFSRQEEIDVVVFAVSAENHFTLSSKEFLFNASNEKPRFFVVVNKFDGIRDKAKCKRMILEQLKNLSPKTSEQADDLVHFVDSKSALARAAFPDQEPPKSSVPQESWEKMMADLRSFLLIKRAISKFGPVRTYMKNLFSDLEFLISTNRVLADADILEARERLERIRPELEKMEKEKQTLEDGLGNEEDEAGNTVYQRALSILEQALDRVGNGEVAVDSTLVQRPSSKQSKIVPTLPSYPGLLHVWDYASAVRKVLLASLDLAVALAEDEARAVTGKGVERVFQLADKHLPPGAERMNRVFTPEAMFYRRRAGRRGSVVVAGGVYGLGIGLAQRQDLLETTVLDIFAMHHHMNKISKNHHDGDEESTGPWSIVHYGMVGISMLGGSAVLGLRSLVGGLAHISDIWGNEETRKYVVPVVVVATLGLGTYIVWELPHTIPKSIGLQIKASLTEAELHHSTLITPQPGFAEGHALRMMKEARKVMRVAAWDTRSRFCQALDEKKVEVKQSEEEISQALTALKFFDATEERIEAVRETAEVHLVA